MKNNFIKAFMEIPSLMKYFHEVQGLGIIESLEKAKRNIGVAVQSKTPKHLTKQYTDIIPPGTDIDNGELYDIRTGETIKNLWEEI